MPDAPASDVLDVDLPHTLRATRSGKVAVLTLARPAKRNALGDEAVLGIERFFTTLPEDIACVVIDAEGDHFCAGLDLSEMGERDTLSGVRHSRMWHRAFEQVEFGPVPVVAALKGAVVGGGLELAAAAHLRVAERSTFYALPEGMRGIFVGGGASVRVPRLIGVARMADLMLTGRRYDAEEGAGDRAVAVRRRRRRPGCRPRSASPPGSPRTPRRRTSRSSRRCRASPRRARARATSWRR